MDNTIAINPRQGTTKRTIVFSLTNRRLEMKLPSKIINFQTHIKDEYRPPFLWMPKELADH